jgi:hypothetical protein
MSASQGEHVPESGTHEVRSQHRSNLNHKIVINGGFLFTPFKNKLITMWNPDFVASAIGWDLNFIGS